MFLTIKGWIYNLKPPRVFIPSGEPCDALLIRDIQPVDGTELCRVDFCYDDEPVTPVWRTVPVDKVGPLWLTNAVLTTIQPELVRQARDLLLRAVLRLPNTPDNKRQQHDVDPQRQLLREGSIVHDGQVCGTQDVSAVAAWRRRYLIKDELPPGFPAQPESVWRALSRLLRYANWVIGESRADPTGQRCGVLREAYRTIIQGLAAQKPSPARRDWVVHRVDEDIRMDQQRWSADQPPWEQTTQPAQLPPGAGLSVDKKGSENGPAPTAERPAPTPAPPKTGGHDDEDSGLRPATQIPDQSSPPKDPAVVFREYLATKEVRELLQQRIDKEIAERLKTSTVTNVVTNAVNVEARIAHLSYLRKPDITLSRLIALAEIECVIDRNDQYMVEEYLSRHGFSRCDADNWRRADCPGLVYASAEAIQWARKRVLRDLG